MATTTFSDDLNHTNLRSPPEMTGDAPISDHRPRIQEQTRPDRHLPHRFPLGILPRTDDLSPPLWPLRPRLRLQWQRYPPPALPPPSGWRQGGDPPRACSESFPCGERLNSVV